MFTVSLLSVMAQALAEVIVRIPLEERSHACYYSGSERLE